MILKTFGHNIKNLGGKMDVKDIRVSLYALEEEIWSDKANTEKLVTIYKKKAVPKTDVMRKPFTV